MKTQRKFQNLTYGAMLLNRSDIGLRPSKFSLSSLMRSLKEHTQRLKSKIKRCCHASFNFILTWNFIVMAYIVFIAAVLLSGCSTYLTTVVNDTTYRIGISAEAWEHD